MIFKKGRGNKMVEVEQIVLMYRSYKETFSDEIIELNKELESLGINCEIISKAESDGEQLLFRKIDR